MLHRWSIARHGLVALIAAGSLAGSATPALAQTEALTGRHAHSFERYEGSTYVRRGVAMFRIGGRIEPATLDLRGQLTGVRPDGWHGARIELRYRFEDGATLTAQADLRFQRNAAGDVSGPQEGSGTFTGGAGRFEGARGSLSIKGLGGIATTAPGILADVFGDVSGELSGLRQPPAAR